MTKSNEIIDYHAYLGLDEILNAQKPLSAKTNTPAHDEMLFIIVHQTYELWFKEILHEIDSIAEMFKRDYIDERNIGIAVSRLRRIVEIQKILVDQIRVIETMTSLDFLDFRHLFGNASGLQSWQFRLVENKLGLAEAQRMPIGGKHYSADFRAEQRKLVEEASKGPTLFDLIGRWLERTPFLKFEGFDFIGAYKEAVNAMLKAEKESVGYGVASAEGIAAMIKGTEDNFNSIFDRAEHERLVKNGYRRLSYDALWASLFISLYRDEPILQLPFQLLELLTEIDEHFTVWRSRHAMMAFRMVGRKMGSGESSGYDYLKRTVDKYKIFNDFFNLSTFFIPKARLPKLPESLIDQLAFNYSIRANNSK